MKQKHVVLYSSGASSSWVGKYVIDKYGHKDTIFLHTDTKWEHEDNYRFMEQTAAYCGMNVTYFSDGRTPEEIFRELSYFGNFGTAPCSKELKMKKTFEFVQELILDGYLPVLYFGIDYKEVQRAPRIAYNYKHNVDVFEDGVETRFPLIGEIDGVAVNGEQLLYGTDYLNSEKMPKIKTDMVFDCLNQQPFKVSQVDPKREIKNDWGIDLPKMYELGFSHANCSGRCIKGGRGHYALLYRTWKDVYMEQEKMEQEINDKQLTDGKRRYTILSQETDEGKVPFSLKEFREQELEGGQITLELGEDLPCNCVF